MSSTGLKYEVFMPAGDIDWLGQDIPLAATNDYDQMRAYVQLYHFGRNNVFSEYYKPLEKMVEGPIYVKVNHVR